MLINFHLQEFPIKAIPMSIQTLPKESLILTHPQRYHHTVTTAQPSVVRLSNRVVSSQFASSMLILHHMAYYNRFL